MPITEQPLLLEKKLDKDLRAIAIHTLYDQHNNWLINWLYKKVGCFSDASDLAQDTFVRIIADRDVSAIHAPRSYLATIARGLMINHFRRRDIERACLEALASLPQSQEMSSERQHELLETLIYINVCLDGLPLKVKRAFLLSQLDGLSYKQIAKQLDVSVSSIKKYMFKAIQHLLLFNAEA